jgi:hypothetical protein
MLQTKTAGSLRSNRASGLFWVLFPPQSHQSRHRLSRFVNDVTSYETIGTIAPFFSHLNQRETLSLLIRRKGARQAV